MFRRKLLCRICLNESNEIIAIDSYLSDRINVRIQEALEKVMSLPLIINDVYPNQICRVCLGYLRISYKLRIEFEHSESILMKCYKHVGHPSPDKKPKTSCAPVEVVVGSNKYDLKDLVIIEEPQTTEVNFDGFLNNLGQSISAKFVNKQFEVNSKRCAIPDISVERLENNPPRRTCKQRVKTPVLSIDNVTENNSSIVNISSLDSSIKKGQFQFVLVNQGDYAGIAKYVVRGPQTCEEKKENMIEEHPHQVHSTVEIIEFENISPSLVSQDNENLEVTIDKNELIGVDTKMKYSNRESKLIDQYIIHAENKNLQITNKITKNYSKAVRRKAKCRNRESKLLEQFIIEAENENLEIANDKYELLAIGSKNKYAKGEPIIVDQYIVQAKNNNLEITTGENKNGLITVGSKKKCLNRESRLVDQYIIEAGNENNKNLEIANDKYELSAIGSKNKKYANGESIFVDQYIVQAKNDNLEIATEGNKNGLITVGSKKKCHNRESRLIDHYIMEAGNNVEFDISGEPEIPESFPVPINIAIDDVLRQMETCENQQTKKTHTCKICKLKFRTRHSYTYHLTKHSEQKHMCDFCGKKFYTKGSLSRHTLIHTVDKTTVLCICPVCGKTFHYKGALFHHMKYHTNEGNYCCDYCDRRFHTLTVKKQHDLTHTGERPYSCGTCNKKFFSSGELNKHKHRHKVERLHHCEFCGKGFITRFNMNIHLFSHPGDFVCEFCNRGFITKTVLKSHSRSKHKTCIVEEAGNS